MAEGHGNFGPGVTQDRPRGLGATLKKKGQKDPRATQFHSLKSRFWCVKQRETLIFG